MSFTFVQEAHNLSYTTGQPTLTTGSYVTQGNLLVSWCTFNDSLGGNNATAWPSDGFNAWQPLVVGVNTGGYGRISIWYAIARRTRSLKLQFFKAGNPTFGGGDGTTPGNLTTPACQVLEFSGNGQLPFLSAIAASGTGTSPQASVTGGSLTGLVIGISVPPTTTNLATETAGWTNAAGASTGSSAIYAIESGAGSYTPVFSLTSSGEWGTYALAFNLPAATATISGNIGAHGKVQIISNTLNYRQTVTTDSGGNYTSSGLEADTYTVIPQATGAVYSPYSATQVVSGANVTLNFAPTTVNTSVKLFPHWVDTMTRANVNPIASGWVIDGTPVPPFDPALAIVSNECVMADATIYGNLAGPWCGDGIAIWSPGNNPTADQYMQLQVDALSSDPFEYASAYCQVRTGGSDFNSYDLTIKNVGDGTADLFLTAIHSDGTVLPANWFLGYGQEIYGVWTDNVPFTLGDTFGLAIVGSTLYIYSRGSIVGTFSDSNLTSGTFCIEITGKSTTDVQLSNFIGGTASLMPTYAQLATDNFVRAAENPLSDGGKWIVNSGATGLALVSSQNVTANNTSANANYFNGSISWPNDQYAECTISTPTSGQFLAVTVRNQAGSGINNYTLYVSPGTNGCYIQKLVAGTGTTLTNFTITPVTGDVIRLEVQGTTLTAKQNGTVVSTTTDSTYTSGVPGIGHFGSIGNAFFTGPWNGGSITSVLLSTTLSEAPIPATVANSSGHAIAITSPTLGSKMGQPTPVVFTDANGNELSVTGGTVGSFEASSTPVVLCDSTGHPLAAPIVITSNGNTLTISSTTTGVKLGQPVPVVFTDPNGFPFILSGFTLGSMLGNPTPIALTDANGNTITLSGVTT